MQHADKVDFLLCVIIQNYQEIGFCNCLAGVEAELPVPLSNIKKSYLVEVSSVDCFSSFKTVIKQVFVRLEPSKVETVIVVVPGVNAVIFPFELTLATDGLEDVYCSFFMAVR